MKLLKNPLILALDVDKSDEAFRILEPIQDLVGGIKLGPRLVNRYGSDFVGRIAKYAPVFIDNKYFDIPSTMKAAVQTSFDAGATLVTVHALAGLQALSELAQLEKELNRIRPFKILAVTILTSWDQSSLPNNFQPWSISDHVRSLADLVYQSGLRGLVCSGHELEIIPQNEIYKVVPGIRLAEKNSEAANTQDQKRIMTPQLALQNGAQALVIGRPILEARDSRKTVLDILESCTL